jgi:hypothetical protein
MINPDDISWALAQPAPTWSGLSSCSAAATAADEAAGEDVSAPEGSHASLTAPALSHEDHGACIRPPIYRYVHIRAV